ncbi:MAG: H+-translocating transhydrogenase subunit alpha [Pseudonocardiales bacterium]|nr:H+-translocating transhydrogenase subunit alpha [Pseudonocardiales bacterium]
MPRRRPPELLTAAAPGATRPGSVVVDTAVGPLGGNVAGSVPTTVVLPGGVTVVGAGGGYLVTDRMLAMLRSHRTPARDVPVPDVRVTDTEAAE